jgi:HEAT repeat protein
MRAWTAKDPKPPPGLITWLLRLTGTGSGPSRPHVLDGGKEAVPVLIELVREEEPWVRILAIRSLGRIGPEAREAVPALIEVLGDSRIFDSFDEPRWDWEGGSLSDWACLPVYQEAAAALGAIGPDAKAAVPDLIKLRRTDGGNDYTSSTIDHALKGIDPAAAAELGIR